MAANGAPFLCIDASTMTGPERSPGKRLAAVVRHGEERTAHHRVSSWLLVFCGASLVGIGLYFLLIRPPLLPEDVRYIGASLADLLGAAPGLANWLQKVFWVLGGYITGTGLFTIYVARTSFRTDNTAALPLLALTGLISIGWMSVVNVMIDSDFKWPLVLLAFLWAGALALHRAGR